MDLIGQPILMDRINSLNINNFPKTIILLGDLGCGKHLLASILKDKLNIDLNYLDKIDSSVIEEINLKPTPSLYFIDGDSLDAKQQNILLKTAEEPLKNAYLIISSQNLGYILPTIINRSVVFKFTKYEKEDLIKFLPESYKHNLELLNIFDTPGKLKTLNNINFEDYNNFCTKIVDKIDVASLANTLTLKDKINYKDNYDKYDLNIVMSLLLNISYNRFLNLKQDKYFNFYKITSDYIEKMKNNKLNKESLFSNYLINLWGEIRGI